MTPHELTDPPSTDPSRFARGFLMSDAALRPPSDDWVSVETAGLSITRAPEVPLTVARSGRHIVVVLGHLIDTEMWASTEAAVTIALEALARSEGEFLDATDAWSGRYLVLFGDGTSTHVMTDASGMRSAFYGLEGPFVLASYGILAATAARAPKSSVVDAYRAVLDSRTRSLVMPMPGRSTPWSGIVYLTANVVLDVETRRLRRIFPRGPSRMTSPAEAASLVAPRLRGQLEALVETGRSLAISITAGVDSRVTLAASRHVRDRVRYFTYRRGDRTVDDADVATTSSMAETLRLPHEIIDVGDPYEAPELTAAIREATFLSHGAGIVAAYRAAFTPDTLHIRSNVGEVGRCFYRRTRVGAQLPSSPAYISATDLARLWAYRDVAGPVVEAFEEWMVASEFREAVDVDPLDLLYWEHRMSCWHSNVVLESDFAFDTHVLFNSRWILERMLSVPQDPRCRGAVFRHLIAELWPELAQWPMAMKQSRSTAGAVGANQRQARVPSTASDGNRSVFGSIRRRISR